MGLVVVVVFLLCLPIFLAGIFISVSGAVRTVGGVVLLRAETFKRGLGQMSAGVIGFFLMTLMYAGFLWAIGAASSRDIWEWYEDVLRLLLPQSIEYALLGWDY
jgi:hypothetical protein